MSNFIKSRKRNELPRPGNYRNTDEPQFCLFVQLGMTPLHWAVQNGHEEVVKLLLEHNAQPDILNKFDLTPADIARQNQRQDLIDILTTNDSFESIVTFVEGDNDLTNQSGCDSPGSTVPLGIFF